MGLHSRRLTRAITKKPTAFILGITEPTRSNTGCIAGLTLTNITGDYYATTPGAVIEKLDINGRLLIRANNITVRNCIIRGGADTTINRFLIEIQSTVTGTVLEFLTIIPEYPSVHAYGVKGANYTIRRCFIGGKALLGEANYLKDGPVDALNFDIANCVAEGCCLETSQYPVDPVQGGGPSHSDGLQVSGGSTYRIIGCSLNTQSQGIVLTPYASHIVGIEVIQNWFYGAFTQFSSWPRWDEGGPGIPLLTIVGNRFRAKGPNPTDVQHNILLTPESNIGADIRDNVLLDGVTPTPVTIAANNQGTLPTAVTTPVANAGPDQIVPGNRRVVLMVRGQTDTGIPQRWRWERADGGSAIALTRSGYADYYVAPDVSVSETVTWRLITTTTGGVDSTPDTCVITHTPRI